jgi:hypothetical protein
MKKHSVDVRAPLAGLLLVAVAAAQAQQPYLNETRGGPLRPGVYGRILVRNAPPPPLISARPVVASTELGPPRGDPIYLYVPAGQVRKWSRYCGRYDACERPVYFVRVDDNPGKLGRWKSRPAPQDRAVAGASSGPSQRF